MSAFARTFSGVRHSLGAVCLIAALVLGASVVFPLLGLIALILLTPALIEAVLNGPHSFVSAWRAAVGRVGRYCIWLLLVTVAVFGTAVAAVAIGASLSIWNWTVEAGITYVAVWAILITAIGVVGNLLATAVAAGFTHPRFAVKAALVRGRRLRTIGTLAALYVIEMALAGTVAVLSYQYGTNALLAFEQSGNATPASPMAWLGIVAALLCSGVMTVVVKPNVEAAVLGAPAHSDL